MSKSKKIQTVKTVISMAFYGALNICTIKLHKKNAVSGRIGGQRRSSCSGPHAVQEDLYVGR